MRGTPGNGTPSLRSGNRLSDLVVAIPELLHSACYQPQAQGPDNTAYDRIHFDAILRLHERRPVKGALA
jgi:hypothetical protein